MAENIKYWDFVWNTEEDSKDMGSIFFFYLKDYLVHTTVKATAYEIKEMRQTRSQIGW